MSIKNRKLQMFVSSTFTDLKEERQKAVEAILSTGHIPAGMELFAAGDQSQMEVIKEWIRDSDVYLLILGSRYGSVEPESGKSYTHLEYEYAIEIGRPHFAIVISDKGETLKVENQGKQVLERDHSEKYNKFKEQVTKNKLVHFWDDLNGIELAIHKSLAIFSKREELVGWVRGDQAFNGGALAEELANLGKENRELREELLKLQANSISDYNGMSFDELFQVFEKKKFQIQDILKDIPDYNEYTIPKKILRESISLNEMNANDMLIILSSVVNGFSDVKPMYCKGFFNFLQQYGLITFVIIPRAGMAPLTSCDFTEIGINYINRLRPLEKYEDLVNKSQVYNEEYGEPSFNFYQFQVENE